jgi:hypothetical protein
MPGLPESPRARRRLAWIAGVCAFAALGAVIALLFPNKGPAPSAPTTNEGPAQLAVVSTRVSLAERRAIDATLDRFIPAAMARTNATVAWALAGPELRANSSLAAWRKGDSPIPYYRPREQTFHEWQTIDSGPRYVIFNLLVHPQKGFKLAPYVLSGEVVKPRRMWLVNRLYPISIENPVTPTTHEVGPADFGAPSSSASAASRSSRLGSVWIIPAVFIFSLFLLIPLTLGVVALVRARRWRRDVRRAGRTELPPLPTSHR